MGRGGRMIKEYISMNTTKLQTWMIIHARRIASMVANIAFGNNLVYRLIGFLNRAIFKRRFKTVFLLYPANEKYLLSYAYLWYAQKFKWKPCLLGLFRQDHGWGLIFGISAMEKDFLRDSNGEQIQTMERSMENIRKIIGAKQKSFAGILPGLLGARGIVDNPVESLITAKVVLQALRITREQENLKEDTDIVILGGNGFVGRLVVKALADTGYRGAIHSVDVGNCHEFKTLSDRLRGKSTILLNATKRGALGEYIPLLWPEVVVLNEVYPEPSRDELNLLNGIGIRCYHIVGMQGKSWPAFPRGYAGGIPCCASFLPEAGEKDYRVIIERKS